MVELGRPALLTCA